MSDALHQGPLHHGPELRDPNGAKVENRLLLLPLCHAEGGDRLRFLGTAFFFAANLAATAKHVVMLDESTPVEGLVAYQFLSDNIYVRRAIVSVAPSRTADVAVVCLAPMQNTNTRTPLLNPLITLTEDAPDIGETVSTCAFPNTIVEPGEIPKVFFNTSWEVGHVEAAFPTGRDRVLKPEPCFQTSLALKGGTSGGPVFDGGGRCFAVNSTSFDEDRPSFVTPVSCIFPLQLGPSVVLQSNDGSKVAAPTVRQLIKAGHVLVQ